MAWLRNDPTRHVLRFHAASGRWYDVVMVRGVNLTNELPPSSAVEHPDDTIGADGRTYDSLDSLAADFGCTIVSFEEAAEEN